MVFTVNKKAFCVFEFAKTESNVTAQRRFRIMYHTEPTTDKTIREWYMNSSRVAACALRNEQAVRAHRPGRPVRFAYEQPVVSIFTVQESPQNSWPLRLGPIVCPETSIRNYHYSPHNNPEERSSQLFRCRSLISPVMCSSREVPREVFLAFWQHWTLLHCWQLWLRQK